MSKNSYCGFLNIRKPRKMTSNDVVEKVRHTLGVNAGHTGTLDPQAEGVLVLGLGPARKFIAYMRTDKEYEGVMRLGQESDTLDIDGQLTSPVPVTASPDDVRAETDKLTGHLELPVPVYSAIHVGGRRLYEIARAGEEVTPPIRAMRIFSLDVIEISLPQVRFQVSCAGGTYIRSLTAEWGRRLGCGAVLERLVRTRSGNCTIGDSTTLEELATLAKAGRAEEVIVNLNDALAHLPSVSLDGPSALRLRHGQTVPAPAGFAAQSGQMVRLNARKEESAVAAEDLIGIGCATEDKDGLFTLRPERMMAQTGNQ